MNKQLTFNSFYNDYNVSNINCVDISLATCLGQLNPDLYYYYCFIYGIHCTWPIGDKDSDDLILNELGFELIQIKDLQPREFFKIIMDLVNKNHIVFLGVKYRALFYYKSYMDLNDKGQTILPISGYDSNKSTITVMEMTLPRKTLYSMISGEVYCPLQITNSMLEEIMQLTDNAMKEDNSTYPLGKKAFYLKEKENKKITFSELFVQLFDAIKYRDDYLLIILDNIQEFCQKTENIIKKCLNSFWIIIDVLIKYLNIHFNDANLKKEIIENYTKSLTECFNERKRIVYLTIKMILRKNVDSEAVLSIKHSVENNNERMLKIIENMAAVFNKKESDTSYNLISSNAVVSADSELRTSKFICNNSLLNNTNYWVSVKAGNIHWIKIDLKEVYDVKKIDVFHFGTKQYNSKNFEILGSIDDQKWVCCFKIENNEEDITSIKNVGFFRFIKIQIIEPNWIDRYARIRRVSVYA